MAVDVIKIDQGPWTVGKTTAFGKIAVMKLDDPPLPGAQVRAEGKAGPTRRAQVTTEDQFFETLKTCIHRPLDIQETNQGTDQTGAIMQGGGNNVKRNHRLLFFICDVLLTPVAVGLSRRWDVRSLERRGCNGE